MTVQTDFFTLFALPRAYSLDKTALEEAYERLSLECHPDFLMGAADEEKNQAQRLSARINEGYRVLSSPTERADYLLSLLANGQTKGGQALNKQALPDGFLQEMFLLQEAVDALDEGNAASGDDSARADTLRQTTQRLETLQAERAALFSLLNTKTQPGEVNTNEDNNQRNGRHQETLQAIQANLNSERYLNRLLERLEGQEMH